MKSLFLVRKEFRDDGIFGELLNERNDLLAVTLEHAYLFGDGVAAKIPPGQYKCVYEFSERFQRELWEVKDVPGATEIKFHVGNYNEDSDGCILLGTQMGHKANGGRMICNSKVAFDRFMALLNGESEFVLKVE